MIPAQAPPEAIDCQKCELAQFRQHVVWGEGPTPASMLFLAESPGAHEDRQARPLVGQAGKMLDKLMEQAGIERKEVYLANMVKCRPPNNKLERYPSALIQCRSWLEQEFGEVRPRVIVSLGATASSEFFPGMAVRELCTLGRVLEMDWGMVEVFGTYHPSAVMRPGGQALVGGVLAQFRRAKETSKKKEDDSNG